MIIGSPLTQLAPASFGSEEGPQWNDISNRQSYSLLRKLTPSKVQHFGVNDPSLIPTSASPLLSPSTSSSLHVATPMNRTRHFPGGIHVPSLTFFKNDPRQEIDWDLQDRHFGYLIEAGLHGSASSHTTMASSQDS